MTHGSLFSGIGGFDLAAEWVGWQNLFNCEIDPFCQTVLKHHFPDAEQFTDIRTADFARYKDRLDVLTGGFPCQPFSTAGKRKGTEDDRYLWPEMLGVIRTVRPRWIVGENVYGIVSWSDGLVFKQVCVDLEAEGYEVQPYVLPACGVGAPYQRYRTWFVAHSAGDRDSGRPAEVRQENGRQVGELLPEPRQPGDIRRVASYSDSDRCRERSNKQKPVIRINTKAHDSTCRKDESTSHSESAGLPPCQDRQGQEQPRRRHKRVSIPSNWQNFPTQPPVCSRDDGLSYGLDGITFSKWRMESIKAYGNAVVPQVVYQIFETINEYEALSRAERNGK